MPSTPTLAKFSRPRLYAVSKRERLFRALDEARAHPIVFIAGAAGRRQVDAGRKLRRVAPRARAVVPGGRRRRRSGDVLPLRRRRGRRRSAARAARARPRRCRAGLAEYATDLAAFTRRFMREFFALFPPDSMLVVDNFHEAAGDARVAAGVLRGAARASHGRQHADPVARRPAAGDEPADRRAGVRALDWESLRFTAAEAADGRRPRRRRRRRSSRRSTARATAGRRASC